MSLAKKFSGQNAFVPNVNQPHCPRFQSYKVDRPDWFMFQGMVGYHAICLLHIFQILDNSIDGCVDDYVSAEIKVKDSFFCLNFRLF